MGRLIIPPRVFGKLELEFILYKAPRRRYACCFFSRGRRVEEAVDGRFMLMRPSGLRPFSSRVSDAVDGRGGFIVPAPRSTVMMWLSV